MARNGLTLELVGRKFGKLTVIRYAGLMYYGKREMRHWVCVCECGKELQIPSSIHVLNRTYSCGCCRNPNTPGKYIKCGDGLVRRVPFFNDKIGVTERLKLLGKEVDRGFVTKCTEWIGGAAGGYGIIRYNGRTVRVHRLNWIINNGEIENGLEVCHHCDNPICYRIDHLFLGTHQENMDDAVSKNRMGGRFGENHHSSKLSEVIVMEIRRRLKT